METCIHGYVVGPIVCESALSIYMRCKIGWLRLKVVRCGLQAARLAAFYLGIERETVMNTDVHGFKVFFCYLKV